MEPKLENKQSILLAKSDINYFYENNDICKLTKNLDNIITIKNESNAKDDGNSSLQNNFKRFLKMRKVLFINNFI